jgi:hypothetical protein
VAGNMAGGAGNDIDASVTADFSLIGDDSGATISGANNLVNIDPLLGPLAGNGGPTQTHALMPDSPAIDKGDANGQTTDQRGVIRTFDQPGIANGASGATDMGAFELGRVVTTTTDENDGPGAGAGNSLRDAIIAANTNAGAEEVFLPAGIYSLTIVGIDDTTAAGDLDILDSLIIRSGDGEVVIDAAAVNTRALEVGSGVTAEILGVTVRGGNVIAGSGDANVGGGIYNVGTLTIADSTISGNTAADDGGGIYSANTLIVHRSTISGNRTTGATASGGGIFSRNGTLTVAATTFSKNIGTAGGGGIYNRGTATITDSTLSGNSGAAGGGIESAISGVTTVNRSTLSGNTASIAGGGLYNSNTLNVFNSTISGNSAVGDGGGIANRDIATAFVTSSTITGNTAGDEGGGLRNASGGSVTLDSTIVDANTAVTAGPDVHGSITANFSLIGNDSSATIAGSDNVLNQDAKLGPLQHNGGPSRTHALLSGSPAIDQGAANGQATDQRGFGRTFDFPGIANAGAGADMGAFEVGLVVTTADDELDADISDPNDLSLREAINFANNTAGGFDITFDPSLAGMPINLTMGQLSITEEVAIRGLGAGDTTIDAGGDSRIFDASGGNFDVAINGLTLTGGQTPANERGGAIRFGFSGSDNTGTLSVTSSTISGNSAGEDGGGGGIYTSSGSVSVTSSTISGNSAGDGGGGICTYSGSVSVTSSTISGNSADGDGGGILVFDSQYDAHLTIASSIVAGNMASGTGNDFVRDPDDTPTVTNSLIGDNTGTGVAAGGTNIVGTGASPVDPLLGPLGNNGGPTQTHALLPGSPALNVGAANGQTTDQRGAPRDDINGVDIGAFELHRNFVVNSIADGPDLTAGDGVCLDIAGGCNLQAAIEETNALPNIGGIPDTIFFNIAGSGPHVISVLGALPNLTDAVIIDGTSEPDFDMGTHAPVVEANGTNAGVGASGFTISGGGGGSVIRGLAINRFDAHGVFVSRRDNVTVEHNVIGTNAADATGIGNGGAGVYVINAENTVVRHNVISGNDLGVKIEGPQSTNNTVIGNLIGTTGDGTVELKNRITGVEIAGSPGNTIGGTALGDRNTISGSREGVAIRGSAATGNVVIGNFIGTDSAGTSEIGNTRGVHIVDGDNNTVGGAGGAANVISGNTKGVEINRGENNLVHGNLIGTDASGDAALANVRGLLIRNAANNQIGNEPNVISGNTREGVKIFGATSTGNVVRDNRIGTNLAGDAPIANREGVIITSGAEGNTIGGTTAAERNVISGNTTAGVFLLADNNSVTGNLIGTNLAGTAAIPNDTGVFVRNSSGNTIGGSVSGGESNLISGNDEQGVLVTGNNVAGTTIAGNAIGTNLAGTAAVANKHGVRIENGAHTIGGATADDGNVISGNTHNGVYIIGAAADGNLLQNNRLGVNIDGSGAVPNERSGVLIENAPNNMVGNAAAGNSIGGNAQQGVKISGASATGNLVQNNAIGLDGLTAAQIGNRDGIRISDGASGNTVGGDAATTANEIAHNTGRGVWISGGTANIVSQNSIHDNTAIGIALGSQNATPNDPDTGSGADADIGANNLQNFPEMTTAILDGANLDITYSVPTTVANSAFPLMVEFFLADAAGTEGETFLGTHSYAAAGVVTAQDIPGGGAIAGTMIVATATDVNGNTSEFSTAANVASSLLAAGGEASTVQGPDLTDAQLSQVAGIAIARLSELGLSADLFANVSYAIADLPGATLGQAAGNTITIDVNAAGWGWAVSNRQSANGNPKTIDLLTTVMHELGHIAGLEDLHHQEAQDDLMYAWLEAGVRKTSLETSFADQAFAEL